MTNLPACVLVVMMRWLLNRKHCRMASLITIIIAITITKSGVWPRLAKWLEYYDVTWGAPLMAKHREPTPSSSTGFVWQNLPFNIHYNHHHPHKSTSHCWTWIRVPWRTKTWLTSSKMSQPSTIILSIARFFRMFSVSETCSKMLERDEIFQLDWTSECVIWFCAHLVVHLPGQVFQLHPAKYHHHPKHIWYIIFAVRNI